MALSEPVARRGIHKRNVVCHGYKRDDGLWDIEGHLTDVKEYPFILEGVHDLTPGSPFHQMALRLTIDDAFTVQAVEATIDRSPFDACPAITPDFQKLVGLAIRPGWSRAVRERLGGVQGCTHLLELLGAIATTAFQTLYPLLKHEIEEQYGVAGKAHAHPALINTCHVFRQGGPS